LLCNVCIKLGQELRIKKLVSTGKEGEKLNNVSLGMPRLQDGKVTVFIFLEIMEWTKR